QEQLMKRLSQNSWWNQVFDWMQQKKSDGMPMQAVSAATTTATSAVSIAISALGGLVLVLFLGFYFALQPDSYRQGFLALLPSNKQQRAQEVLDQLKNTLWRWLLGRMVGMAV